MSLSPSFFLEQRLSLWAFEVALTPPIELARYRRHWEERPCVCVCVLQCEIRMLLLLRKSNVNYCSELSLLCAAAAATAAASCVANN